MKKYINCVKNLSKLIVVNIPEPLSSIYHIIQELVLLSTQEDFHFGCIVGVYFGF